MPSRAQPAATRRVLIATRSDDLLDELLRLAAAAQLEPVVAHDPASVARWWSQVPLVLVGDDMARTLTAPPSRRDGVVLVGRGDDDPWPHAVRLGAEDVVALPDSASRLADRMGEAGDGHASGVVVAVVGACGGAGATTLVAGLATCASQAGLTCAVVDTDPSGNDLDLALDMLGQPGVTWSDLASASGRVPAASLRSALPASGGVALLGFSGTREASSPVTVPAEAVEAVVSALRRGFDLTLVDLPRWLPPPARPALSHAQVCLLAAPADTRGVASTRRLVRALPTPPVDRRVVVRRPRSGGFGPDEFAAAVGVPLAATVGTDHRIGADLANADFRLRPALRRACRAILADLAPTGSTPAHG